MRTTKQLLKILLKQGNKNFEKGNTENDLYIQGYKGLCGFTIELRDRDIITPDECDALLHFIEKNRPTKKSPHYYKDKISLYDLQAYYWPIGLWQPRKAWLEDQIWYLEITFILRPLSST